MDADENIILIGMPGAGKSTVGVVLAKRLGADFIDTDLLIQTRAGKSLQAIINEDGLDTFRRIEEEVLLDLNVAHTVVSTGGSAVYSPAAMTPLKRNGTIVFINTPLQTLQRRIADMESRGMVIKPGDSFAELFIERNPLYRKYADIIIVDQDKSIEEIAAEISEQVARD